MDSTERYTPGIISALTIGLALLLIGGLYYWNDNRKLTAANIQAEQRADSLLSAKFQLESNIRGLNRQLATIEDENANLTKRVETAYQRINDKDVALHKLRRGNANRTATIRTLNEDINKLSFVRDSLTGQMTAMHDKINWQDDSLNYFKAQSNDLQTQVNTLDTRLLSMVPRSAITGDGFRVVTNKANDKVTAKAKKVHDLTVSLNMPAELQLEGMKEVYLSLTNEQREEALPTPRRTTVSLADVNEVIPVHAAQTINFSKNPQRLSFSIPLAKDLKPGIYRASVYTREAYLGSVEFQLRDSFWFF